MTVTQLEAEIRRYQEAYYSGEGLISDAEFDALWDELKRRAPRSPLLAAVGAEAGFTPEANDADGFPKAAHIIPMGSQEKAAGEAEFRAWAEKLGLNQFVVQYKLDGASLELQYEKGRLARAVTRGDGVVGADITPNALKMRGVAHELKLNWTGGVRGEVLLFHDVWKKKYASKANCRNAANGVMRRKDGEGCEDLTLISYDAAKTDDDAFFSTEAAKIDWLAQQGFTAAPTKIFDSVDAIIAYRAEVAARRAALDFDIDGLVVKDPVTNQADLAKARPERQIAFKFDLERAISVLRAVEWSESGATYTPIGIIEPVRLAGTTVKRANLNNPAAIRAMGLKIGSRVIVVKRGEIIPKIEGVVEAEGEFARAAPPKAGAAVRRRAKSSSQTGLFESETPLKIPTKCSSCGSALVDAGTRLYCPNPACPKRLHHRLEKWVSVMDIAELGEKLLRQLFDAGRLLRVADLYTLNAAELAGYERMGEVSAAKVVRHIQTPRAVPLAVFVAGFDIEGIGGTIMEKVVEAGFDTLAKLRAATAEQLAAIFGIGEITAQVITEGLVETAADMDATLACGVIRVEDFRAAAAALAGKSFCFTGELKTMKRAEAETKVKERGGSVKNSVVKGLSFLVTNTPESGSSKNKKARDFGVAIISEEELLKKFLT